MDWMKASFLLAAQDWLGLVRLTIAVCHKGMRLTLIEPLSKKISIWIILSLQLPKLQLIPAQPRRLISRVLLNQLAAPRKY